MSFYVHIDGQTDVSGPFAEIGSAIDRGRDRARMMAARGAASPSGFIVETSDGSMEKAKTVKRFRYFGGPFDSVEFKDVP